MLESYKQFCVMMKGTGKYRQLPSDWGMESISWLDFSSNDYFGLSRHKEVLSAAVLAGTEQGVGSTGSRLLSGNKPLFSGFERQIAQDKGTESALLFNTGFQANLTVLSSLLDARVLKAKPLVFFDRLNHASLYQAIQLSGAEMIRYRHLDYQHLSDCLDRFKADDRPTFIVTETLFGMDGDVLSLDVVLELAREHDAFLYLDEAHAVGFLGERGYGLSTTIEPYEKLLTMGTLSKALGCAGAYVTCSALLSDYLINKAPGFIYSTANSPLTIGAACKAWSIIPTLNAERLELTRLADKLRCRLQVAGFDTGTSVSPIIPIMLSSKHIWPRYERLLEAGIRVSLVRPPTVPPGGERLRIALNVNHTDQDLDRLMEALMS